MNAQEKNSFEQLGLVLSDLPRDFKVMPKAHMAWFANALETGSLDKVRCGLATIHSVGVADDGHIWFVGAFECFWREIPHPETVARWLANRLLSGDATQFDAWVLAVFLGLDQSTSADCTTEFHDQIKATLMTRAKLPAQFLPNTPSKLSYLPAWYEELDSLVAIWPACADAARTWAANKLSLL